MMQSQAIRENGYDISPEQVLPALSAADSIFYEENVAKPLRLRSKEERLDFYTRYESTLLDELGIDTAGDPDIAIKIYNRAIELYGNIGFALFDDVTPTLKKLSEKGIKTGVISNIDIDMNPVCEKLGLTPYLSLIVTSKEAGSDKPKPGIFILALKKAGVSAAEAIHVGDQYATDVVGAKGVGINPVFLDRFNHYPDVTNCPRITTLEQIFDHL